MTIGGSLPIRTTLQDILYSGDAVHSIVGLMSVSAGNVLTELCDRERLFSEALSATVQTGLFEADPFVDLEGTEAAQKLLMFTRELGFQLSLEDIEIEPLATRRPIANWQDPTEVNRLFAAENESFRNRVAKAAENKCTLRYVQRIVCSPPIELGNPDSMKTRPKVSVRLEEVPLYSPYAMVTGTVYYFAFHTERYKQSPLIVQVSRRIYLLLS